MVESQNWDSSLLNWASRLDKITPVNTKYISYLHKIVLKSRYFCLNIKKLPSHSDLVLKLNSKGINIISEISRYKCQVRTKKLFSVQQILKISPRFAAAGFSVSNSIYMGLERFCMVESHNWEAIQMALSTHI